jgi:hypothetical protein
MKSILLAGFMILFYSCNKSKIVPLPSPNLKGNLYADISVAGENTRLESIGTQTIFNRTVNSPGDTTVVAYGENSDCHIQIVLENIHVPGTYIFGQKLDSTQHISVVYVAGDILSGNAFVYSANNQNDQGILVIESISYKQVKGTFTTMCAGISDTAKITNGGFEGDFQ